jgi:ABC-type polysaccharide/polyol phosphate export permease
MKYVKELFATRELLVNLTMREVKGQYRRTVFGQLWSLLNPIATMLVYTLVFSVIFRAKPSTGDPSGLDIYALWLMCGLLPWLYFSRVINGGLTTMVTSANLIKKVYFPRVHLPLSVMLSVGFTWLIEMGVLVLALWIFGAFPLPWIPLVIVFMALLALMAVGFSMLFAILNVHFRDTQHFVTIILQMWMYLTPIIYPVSLVADAAAERGTWILDLYRLNPMERFVAVFRSLLYDNRFPELADTLYCVGAAGVVFAVGFLVFSRNEKRLAELL